MTGGRRSPTGQDRAVARLLEVYYRPDGDRAAGADQVADVHYRYPALASAIEAVVASNSTTETRFICPGCRRPYAAGTRVPRDPDGRVLQCRDCRLGTSP